MTPEDLSAAEWLARPSQVKTEASVRPDRTLEYVLCGLDISRITDATQKFFALLQRFDILSEIDFHA